MDQITTTSSRDQWKTHLIQIGRDALSGKPVEIENVAIPEMRAFEPAAAFIEAVDATLSAATSAPRATGKYRGLPLELALESYIEAVAWCVGALAYIDGGNAEEFYSDMLTEVRAARDALRGLAPSHWDRRAFMNAAERAESTVHPVGWRAKWAPLAFTYDDYAAMAA